MYRLFLDCDGVLADFNSHWNTLFIRSPEEMRTEFGKEKMWNIVRDRDPDFFLNLPLMPDAMQLFNAVAKMDPIILTGSPTDWGYGQKAKWIKALFPDTPFAVCESKHKHYFANKGDIIIDDRTKYKHLWEGIGGQFIVHTSAEESIRQWKETPKMDFEDTFSCWPVIEKHFFGDKT